MRILVLGWAAMAVLGSLIVSCSKNAQVGVDPPPGGNGGIPQIQVNTLLTNRGIIWGMDFLPDGRLIFVQKNGVMAIFDTVAKQVTTLTAGPSDVSSAGQGGLLDVCVHPQYSGNGWIYLTYSSTGGFLRLARFAISGSQVTQWQVLHTTESPSTWSGHYGSRLAFGPDGRLYWAVGEGGTGSYGGPNASNTNPQQPASYWGKIHRMNDDGSVPADNPILPGAAGRTTAFTMGHRNPQGLAFAPGSSALWSTEHGPQGGCELNRITAGANYGWPRYSEGRNYDGTTISNGHNAPGITGPVMHWTPALGPSGTQFIQHASFKDWNGNLLIASLTRRQVLMVSMNNGTPGASQPLLDGIGRVRNVKQAPDGSIYVAVEDGGRLLQMVAL